MRTEMCCNNSCLPLLEGSPVLQIGASRVTRIAAIQQDRGWLPFEQGKTPQATR